ncbi:MAG TPA: BatA domain-containing protein [Gemmatimonadaceae bacterium]
MGFTFLTPLFALGALALAVPILVHLVHKERKETTPFPSLMFLRRTPYQHSRRQRIRDVLLFLLRALAVVLVVAAFARPVLTRPAAAAAATGGGREVVILLDQSFSMRYGNRWTRAQAAARETVDALTGSDRGTIILFDDGARAAGEGTSDKVPLRAAIDSARPSDAATRYRPAFTLARRIVAASRLPRRQVVVITDLQRSAWDLTEEARLPAGTEVIPVDVGTDTVQDRAVRAVELRRDLSGGVERIAVSARISNLGPVARGIEARLDVAGRTVETSRIDLASDGGGMVTFPPIPVPDIPQRAAVRLAADGLPGDDAFHFVLERAPTVPVLIVEDGQPGVERSLYLRRALEIGDKPAFEVTVRRATQLNASDFGGKRLVILHDVPYPSGEAARRLESFVRGGGGLIIAQGDRMAPRTWPSTGNGLLPARVGDVTDRIGSRGAVLGFVDRAHPALAVFGSARSGDLSAARFFRYRPIATDSGVLARFDDGQVALAEHRMGRGRVLVWASTFDGYWNDLPRQPVFLPLIHQLARYASAYRASKSVYEVGEAVDLGAGGTVQSAGDTATAPATAHVVVAPSGARMRVGGEGGLAALVPREAGMHEIRRAGAPGERPRLVAVNVPARELDFSRIDPTRLTSAVAPIPETVGQADDAGPADPATQEREQSLWWYLLVVAAGLLVAESLLADRLTRARSAPARS